MVDETPADPRSAERAMGWFSIPRFAVLVPWLAQPAQAVCVPPGVEFSHRKVRLHASSSGKRP
jgi:hypothetical protein